MSAPMVRAILSGTKTQTRRVVRWPWNHWPKTDELDNLGDMASLWVRGKKITCPYGQPGDGLWVKETGWERPERTPRMMREGADTWEPYYYDADDGFTEADHEQFKEWGFKRRPSIFMPRWASRITLEVTDVRVERLNDASDYDLLCEGVESRNIYVELWNRLNEKRGYSWAKNPWVWVLEFRKV